MVMPPDPRQQPTPRENLTLDLDIESVVFHDFPHLNRQRVGDALHGELTRLLNENAVNDLALASAGGEIDLVRGVSLNIGVNTPAEIVGQRLARAIFDALRGDD